MGTWQHLSLCGAGRGTGAYGGDLEATQLGPPLKSPWSDQVRAFPENGQVSKS